MTRVVIRRDRWLSRLVEALARPALDTWRGLDRLLVRGPAALGSVFAGLLVGWWLYVPSHELLHAVACLAAGGEVTELQISPLYGGALLAKLVPWITAGGPYAGRLVGFDTGGRDWVYLVTDFGPYLLTLFPGVWALRRAVMAKRPFLYGAALPFALAPFLSLTGDAYEIGSILLTQLPAFPADALRSDDLFAWVASQDKILDPPWMGAALATLIGLIWALTTYAFAAALAKRLGAGAVAPLVLADPSAPVAGVAADDPSRKMASGE